MVLALPGAGQSRNGRSFVIPVTFCPVTDTVPVSPPDSMPRIPPVPRSGSPMTSPVAPRRALRFLVLAFALAAPGAAASTLPSRFQESAVITGLVNPTAVRFAANGQIFVAEKSGRVLAYDGIGDTLPTQVIDLGPSVHNFWDRGLLGLAIDPGWPV